jgi:esterase/lipase
MQLPNIILIHGLNNRPEAFWPIRDSFIDLGYKVHLVCLPGHGEDRTETENWDRASGVFKKSLEEISQDPYVVIAFSQGALYFQDWLTSNDVRMPLAQILLSPALFIRNSTLISLLTKILHPKMKIPSTMPESLRRYHFLYISEYRNLLEGIKKFGLGKLKFPIPTMVVVDNKDELVDAKKLKMKFDSHVTILERPYLLGRRPGKYHIIFHPDYFEKQHWDEFITTLHQWIGLNSLPSK